VGGDEAREIAGFRIESEIGRGGMGVVYLAHQSFPDRMVALKLLSPDLADDPAFRERFIRESNAAASTEHPNIVPVYGAGEVDGRLYLAMRYVEGTDLGTLLVRESRLSPERAALICAQIADALGAAHERGLIHRDVKPGNILLDARDHAYLTDFGLIRRTKLDTDITRTGQFMGTIDYVAPEQIKGGEIDGRADVYSLGCVLYECLTGTPPFRKDSEVATIYAHLQDPPPKPDPKLPGMSPAVAATVTKAMAKRPDDRFASAGAMAAALRGTGVARPRASWRGRMIAGTVAVAVALAAIVAVVTISGDGDRAQTLQTTAAPALNSLIQVDAETGEILAVAEGMPSAGLQLPQVELGEGGVWVLSGGTLVHVDPSTAEPIAALTVGALFTPVDALAVWARTVWVAAPPGLVRINPATDHVLRSVRLEGGLAEAGYVAAGGSSLWTVTGGELTRVDQLGRPTGSADVGQGSTAIAAGLDAVWIADDLQGNLTKVDPDALRVLDVAPVPGNIDSMAVASGSVWILDSDAGVATPFDPTSLSAGSPVRVGVNPTDMAIGLDAVWVSNQGDGTISRIDPVTHDVQTIPIGAPAAAIAVDDLHGVLWVAIAQRREGGD
jgi:streptogramin lyase